MAATLLHPRLFFITSSSTSRRNSIQCSDPPPSNRGFVPKSRNADSKKMKSSLKQSSTLPNQSPGLSSPIGGSLKYPSSDDLEFEERLQAIKKSALEQKKTEVEKDYRAIDYDAPTEKNSSPIGLGTKIGVGVAVVAFGLVFALGDFLPSGSVGPTEETTRAYKISEEERAILEKRLNQFEETLSISPEDSTALEGAAVTLAEMREYKRAAALLEKLTEQKKLILLNQASFNCQMKSNDPEAFRLLGEVKYELQDYQGSVLAYRSAEGASKGVDFEILRGLTNSLLASKNPDLAVQVVLETRERLSKNKITSDSDWTDESTAETRSDVDPIQVELLLGKAYSDWGHISDAISVYDQVIASHPDDFRGYLAKGIILKENGSIGDAERMFIQARFFAPDRAKALVQKYSR